MKNSLIKGLNLKRYYEGGYWGIKNNDYNKIGTLKNNTLAESTIKSIYYMLESTNFLKFRRCSHSFTVRYSEGDTQVVFITICNNGELNILKLGNNRKNKELSEVTIFKDTLFALFLNETNNYSLLEFENLDYLNFDALEKPNNELLKNQYPEYKSYFDLFNEIDEFSNS